MYSVFCRSFSALLILSVLLPSFALAGESSLYAIEGRPAGGAAPVAPLEWIASTPKSSGLAGSVVTLNAKSVRVKKDTILRLRLLNELHSNYVREGESFTAYLDEPLYGSAGRVLLPKGTLLRGRIQGLVASKFFGKGASFRLDFDHATLPNGEVLPVALKLGSINQLTMPVKSDGTVYEDPGYAEKFASSLDKTGYLISDVTRKGYEAGVESGGKALGALTGTFSAIGGAFAGAGYLVGKSVYHAVAKGEPVILEKNDALYVQLLVDTDIPVQ